MPNPTQITVETKINELLDTLDNFPQGFLQDTRTKLKEIASLMVKHNGMGRNQAIGIVLCLATELLLPITSPAVAGITMAASYLAGYHLGAAMPDIDLVDLPEFYHFCQFIDHLKNIAINNNSLSIEQRQQDITNCINTLLKNIKIANNNATSDSFWGMIGAVAGKGFDIQQDVKGLLPRLANIGFFSLAAINGSRRTQGYMPVPQLVNSALESTSAPSQLRR